MIEVIEPATEAVLEELPRAGVEEVDAAVERAREAFPGWRAMAPARPGVAAVRAGRRAGRPRARSWPCSRPATPASRSPTPAGEMDMVAATFRYYAGAPERLLGDTIPVAGGQAFTVREPLGVVGLIVPWNFPLTIASWKLAPGARGREHRRAQAGGAHPADRAAVRFDRAEAGIPEGVVNVVVGPGSVCGRRLVEHPDVAKIAFTGLDRGRPLDRRRRGGDDQARDARARRQVPEPGVRGRRPRGGGRGGADGRVRQRRAGLLRALADPRPAVGARPVHGRARGRRRVDPRRRPARRGHADGPADLGRAPRRGVLVRRTATRRSRSAAAPRTGPGTGSPRRCSVRSIPTRAPRARRSSGRWRR